MRALLLCTLVAAVVGGVLFACNPNSIGRPCVNPGGQAVTGVQLSSPALECPSRLCLIEPAGASSGNIMQTDAGTFRATCTATCGSDGDCSPETNSYCQDAQGHPLGFVCAVASSSGPFCCKKVCICKGDLVAGFNQDVDGGAALPFVCDPKRDVDKSGTYAGTCANVTTK
jgi:hypothetical protein